VDETKQSSGEPSREGAKLCLRRKSHSARGARAGDSKPRRSMNAGSLLRRIRIDKNWLVACLASRNEPERGSIDRVLNLPIASRTNPSRQRHCLPRRLRRSTSGTESPFRSGEFHMKYFLSALIAIGLSIAAAPSFAADARNVTVVNETGYAIKFLGFNAPDDGMDEWDNELEKVLQNQASTYVEFDDDDDGCVWNVRVDWQNYDETVLWKNVNLCKFTALRLRYDSGTKTTSFVAE
jgi:hypothetical protein